MPRPPSLDYSISAHHLPKTVPSATLSITANNAGAFTPGAGDTLVEGAVVETAGRALFLNADVGTASMTASGLANCTIPTLLLEAGISSALAVCDPN